ncbi:RNA polymerase sigma factor [Crocinitomix algicola]|uniref:RNA polymerase sigma factor n=1 Tax=Crocinitomix algicola TaxID=1740263 RepID=UPI0008732A8A|nr:sigma-70 family RNA polymerase sigma factor [Crocinitomix algicola]
MTNEKLIQQLKCGMHEKAFRYLYKNLSKVEAYVKSNSGTKSEALDVFQDGLIVLYNKVNAFSDQSEVKVEGFLINTCKLLWKNELKKKRVRNKKNESIGIELKDQSELEDFTLLELRYKIVEKIISKLGETCRTVLVSFYYKKHSLESIAKQLNYKSVQTAKTKKYKCMEKARKMAVDWGANSLNHQL